MVIEKNNDGQTVFSFLEMLNDERLFILVAKILDVPYQSRVKVKILEKYQSFFEGLVMKYKKEILLLGMYLE